MQIGLDIGSTTIKCVVLDEQQKIIYSSYERHFSQITEKAAELFTKMKNSTINPVDSPVFISHGDCIEDAEYLASKIKNELGIQEVVIGYVGPVIGSHSGPGTLALFFLAKER